MKGKKFAEKYLLEIFSTKFHACFFMARRTRLGARCVVFNNRGRGGHTLKTPRTYCASKTDDLAAVIDHIKTKNPSASLMALGVSLGKKYFALNKFNEVQEENKLKN